MTRPHRSWKAPATALIALLSFGLFGCAVLGVVAAKLPQAPVKARYAGLAGQQVAVVVWVDRATGFEYNTLRSELTREIARKLRAATATAEDLKGTYVIDAARVLKWQRDHPEYEGRSVNEVAPLIATATGATRVVYVELSKFTTRDAHSDALLKGRAEVIVKVAEVTGGAKAREGYNEVGVEALFPEKAPEGVPISQSINIEYVYGGLVNELTKQVAVRFFAVSPDEG
ncbi:MAG TPA: hypothetical protein VEA69_22665 [Tepidisphaeraceae bacterium]|nr:hypothetical protein [Tepidisphaeraceae bacterium]